MSIGDRLLDDSLVRVLRDGDEPHAPQFVFSLLTRLSLEDAPRAEQVAALRTWLSSNTPSESLLQNLAEEGYDDALSAA